MKKNLNHTGFTLIELLIVIVIIGILAGVLIAVIDPAAQQNRARDGNVQSTLNKMAMAAGGFRSAYGVPPDGFQFLGSINGGTPAPAGTCTAGTTSCNFTLATGPLPLSCAAAQPWHGNVAGGTGTQCVWRYQQNGANNYWIFGRAYGIINQTFRYDSITSTIERCTSDGTNITGCVAI